MLLGASCATITTGTHEKINVDSNPSSAAATLTCDRAEAQHAVTPATFTIARKAGNCTLSLEKDGYDPKRLVLEEGINGRFWGNFAFSPLIPTGLYFIIDDQATSSDKAAGTAMLATAGVVFLTDFVTGAMYEHTVDGRTVKRIEVELKPKQ